MKGFRAGDDESESHPMPVVNWMDTSKVVKRSVEYLNMGASV